MRKKQYLFIAFFSASAMMACNSNVPKSNEGNLLINQVPANVDSEMTVLMREMYYNFEIIKDSIVAGKTVDRILFNDVRRTHWASPTDSTIMGPAFEGMTVDFLDKVDSLLLEEVNKEMYFNLTVQACLNCHQEFCPGPMGKITKLLIKPKR
ncbi:MAG: hypothetical protein HOK72_05435 [Flavobacteriales bacterium]|nr:hypothetical protein [Flavobacteriales bacterium]